MCKPAIPLELKFYQALDKRYQQLKPFVPPFVGVVTVELSLLSGGATGAGSDSDASSVASMSASSSVGDLAQLATERKSPVKGPFIKVPLPNTHGKKRRFAKHPSGGTSPAGYSAKLWRKERTKRKAGIARSNSSGSLKDILFDYEELAACILPCSCIFPMVALTDLI